VASTPYQALRPVFGRVALSTIWTSEPGRNDAACGTAWPAVSAPSPRFDRDFERSAKRARTPPVA
jgi:hypothetical protein